MQGHRDGLPCLNRDKPDVLSTHNDLCYEKKPYAARSSLPGIVAGVSSRNCKSGVARCDGASGS